jgi:hypothetical protein
MPIVKVEHNSREIHSRKASAICMRTSKTSHPNRQPRFNLYEAGAASLPNLDMRAPVVSEFNDAFVRLSYLDYILNLAVCIHGQFPCRFSQG